MRFNIPNEKDTIMDNQFQKAWNKLGRGPSDYVLQGASTGNMQLGQEQCNYAMQGAIAGASEPRKIGIIDRVQGINGGLSDLYGRLISLIDRVEGNEPFGTKLSPVPSVGLSGVLSDAESNLRGCLELINQLNAKF